MRCFIALPLPDSISMELDRAVETIRERTRHHGFTWTRPEAYHVTLAFLGDLDETLAGLAAKAVDDAKMAPSFDTRSSGLVRFPSRGTPRILALGFDEGGAKSCSELWRVVNEALVREAEKAGSAPLNDEYPDGKPFTAHVTLARVKDEVMRDDAIQVANDLEAALSRLQSTWSFDACILYRSKLGPKGACYSVLHETRLGGKA